MRYEAEIAHLAHAPRRAQLTRAMVEMLEGTELALRTQAAWALGRMGDPAAIEPLRQRPRDQYRSVRLQSIRALGWLGDVESVPTLLDDLRGEADKGLQMAYASALGNLPAPPRRRRRTCCCCWRRWTTPVPAWSWRWRWRGWWATSYLHAAATDPRQPGYGGGADAVESAERRTSGKRRRKKKEGEGADGLRCVHRSLRGGGNGPCDGAPGPACCAACRSEALDDCPRAPSCRRAPSCWTRYGADRTEVLALALHTLDVRVVDIR